MQSLANTAARVCLNISRHQRVESSWRRFPPCASITKTSHVRSLAIRTYAAAAGASHNANKSEVNNSNNISRKKKRAKGLESGSTSLRLVAAEAQMGLDTMSPASSDSTANAGKNTITAISVAEAFDMNSIQSILRAHQYPIDPDGTGFAPDQLIHTRGTNRGDLFIFPSGTLVTWSIPPDIARELAKDVLMPATIGYSESKMEMEDLQFKEDPSETHSVAKDDLVILGTKARADAGASGGRSTEVGTTYAKIAFSSGLARSTKLAVLETMLRRYFEKTRHIPKSLSEGQRLTIDRDVILRRTGELLELRAQLNHYSELTDSLPDVFWDKEHKLGLEDSYEQIGRVLDVGTRIRTLNQKMDYAQEIATILRQYLSEKHSTKLEWIIILLIFVEVLFGMRGIYQEYETSWKEDAAVAAQKL